MLEMNMLSSQAMTIPGLILTHLGIESWRLKQAEQAAVVRECYSMPWHNAAGDAVGMVLADATPVGAERSNEQSLLKSLVLALQARPITQTLNIQRLDSVLSSWMTDYPALLLLGPVITQYLLGDQTSYYAVRGKYLTLRGSGTGVMVSFSLRDLLLKPLLKASVWDELCHSRLILTTP